MAAALYGPAGFFVAGPRPRPSTSAPACTPPARSRRGCPAAVAAGRRGARPARPVRRGRRRRGARRAAACALDALAPPGLRERLRADRGRGGAAARGPACPRSAGDRDPPADLVGLLVATEWLDNVPLDVAVDDRYADGVPPAGDEAVDGAWRTVTGPTRLARPLVAVAARGARSAGPGTSRGRGGRRGARAGWRSRSTTGTCGTTRPLDGSLTGFRAGRQVAPVPDGSCDLTAHVAMDAVAAAPGLPYRLISQREALRALGVDGARPPLAHGLHGPGRLRAGAVRAPRRRRS